MLAPLSLTGGNGFKRFDIGVIKSIRQHLLAISALFEFGLRHSGDFFEVPVAVQDFVHLVFNLRLQVQVLQQLGNSLLDLV